MHEQRLFSSIIEMFAKRQRFDSDDDEDKYFKPATEYYAVGVSTIEDESFSEEEMDDTEAFKVTDLSTVPENIEQVRHEVKKTIATPAFVQPCDTDIPYHFFAVLPMNVLLRSYVHPIMKFRTEVQGGCSSELYSFYIPSKNGALGSLSLLPRVNSMGISPGWRYDGVVRGRRGVS